MDNMEAKLLNQLLFFVVNLFLIAHIVAAIVKDTLTMETTERCNKMISNPSVEEGDVYVIKPYDRATHEVELDNNQLPETCFLVMHFGNRLINVKVKRWKCDKELSDVFLGVYDNCDGHTKNPLASFTCGSNSSSSVQASSTCVTIYHHRGSNTQEYYFAVDVIAGHEIRSFPAGAMASVIISTVVLIMILVKIVCMITGYENRLPKLNLNPEEEKKIMEEAAIHVRLQRSMAAGGEDSSSLLVAPPNEYQSSHNRIPRNGSHTSLTVEHPPHLDYDFLNVHTDRNNQPRLKRFPSYKASSIFRH